VSQLEVQLVDSDEVVWTGAAQMVRARSIDGDLGIMPGHTPLLAVLGEGEIVVKGVDSPGVTVTADGGFLSVDRDQVRIVVDSVLTRSA